MKIAIEGAKPTNTRKVTLDSIEVDSAKNLRYAPGDPADLVRSIREFGQKHPVGARLRKGQKPLLSYGYGRYEAISLINAELPEDDKMLIEVSFFEGNEEDHDDNCLAESTYNPFTHMDWANVIRRFKERRGLTGEQIAAKTGRTMGWVSQHDSLNRLPKEIQDGVHNGSVTFTAALQFSQETEQDAAAKFAEINASEDAPKKIRVKDVKPAKEAKLRESIGSGRAGKWSNSELLDFFEQNIGSPAVSDKLQAVSQIIVNMIKGDPSTEHTDDVFQQFESAISGIQEATA